MSPDAQRIAIAESLGWTHVCPNSLCGYRNGRPLADHKPEPPQWPGRLGALKIPDYLNDLNEMHEAEKKIKDFSHYARWLKWISLGLEQIPPKEKWKVVHCTAAQRAQAYLRTIGRWKD